MRQAGLSGAKSRARVDRLITQGLFSLRGARQSILFHGNRLSAGVLYLMGLGRVELDIFRELRRKVLLLAVVLQLEVGVVGDEADRPGSGRGRSA